MSSVIAVIWQVLRRSGIAPAPGGGEPCPYYSRHVFRQGRHQAGAGPAPAATLAELRAFLAGAAGHDFEPVSRREAYGFMRELLRRFPYDRLGRADRGVVRAYLQQATGFSRAQVARLIAPKLVTGLAESNQNDAQDAKAICIAVGRADMRFAPVQTDKTVAARLFRKRQSGSANCFARGASDPPQP